MINFSNNYIEPSDLELYFIELQMNNEKEDVELLQYLLNRDYMFEAASLIKNCIINIEGTLIDVVENYS